MTVEQLIDYLKTFDADAPVILAEWIDSQDVATDIEVCVNFEHQQDNQIVMLRKQDFPRKF